MATWSIGSSYTKVKQLINYYTVGIQQFLLDMLDYMNVLKYMTGKSHTDPSDNTIAIEVMQHLNDACTKWKEKRKY